MINTMMIFTPKILEAIHLAAKAHNGQRRKISGAPYIVHPLSVGLILARLGASEEVIIAGILHDVLEDSKMRGLEKVISEKFGEKVFQMVKDVTENKELPWEERKRLALEHIPGISKDALLMKSADVLNNMTDLVFHVQTKGKEVFRAFNAPEEKQLERYAKVIAMLEKTWKENPLLSELKIVLECLGENIAGKE